MEGYLLALNRADGWGDGDGAASVRVFGQSEGLVHCQAGHVGINLTTDEAHGGGGNDGTAAAIPGVLAVVPIGRLASAKETKKGLYWGPRRATNRRELLMLH